jgi:IS30 family transposase
MKELTKYDQLQPEGRMTIASMSQQRCSVRATARTLHRAPSTISRELLRKASGGKAYGSNVAQQACQARRCAAKPETKLDVDGFAWLLVLTLLDWRWSPQQISGTFKRVFPNDPTRHVSHETIHTAIYAQPRGELRRQLIDCLRRGHSTRRPRARCVDRRGQILDILSIHARPPKIEDRVMPGHWEGDFINGAGNQSSVGVLVEQSSRLVLLAKMEDATAASALAGFSAKLNSIAEPMPHSLTYDQGKEMSRHAELHEQTGVNIYFCDAHSPWQCGTCENTNGLLRQHMPKGTDLSVHTQ